MAKATNDTRERIVTASAELFRRQGYNATGVKQIVADASAPFGSLYHFFPGGKEQLGAETIRWSGARYGELIDLIFDPAPDVVTAVENFFAGAAETLRETGYEDACPIATVALEVASTNETLRLVTHDVFELWLASLTSRLATAGLDEIRARELAILAVTALEGAFMLSRAAKNTEAMHVTGRFVVREIERSLRR